MQTFNWILFLGKTAIRNLLRSPRRTIINVLTIAAAATSMMVFDSFVNAVHLSTRENIIRAHYGHFEISKTSFNGSKSENPFAHQILEVGALREGINKEVGPLTLYSRRQQFFGIIHHNERSFSGVGLGVDAKEFQNFFTLAKVIKGVHIGESDENGVFLGRDQAQFLGATVGDYVTVMVTTETGSVNAIDFEVIGIFKTGVKEIDERTFYIHQKASEDLLQTKGAPEIVIGFDTTNEKQYIKPLQKYLKNNHPELKAVHWQVQASFFDDLMGWMDNQVYVFYAIILTIVSISILNVFSMGLLERLGEFGTLRAIGTKRIEIIGLIFVESLTQAVLGGIAGILFGIFVIKAVFAGGLMMPPPPLMTEAMHLTFQIPWNNLMRTLVLCSGVAGSAGVFPAIKMARANIVGSLARNV